MYSDIHYLSQACSDYMVSAADTVALIHKHEDAGDVLVFMPGQDEIERTMQLISDSHKCVP